MTPPSRVTRNEYDVAVIGAGPAGVAAAAAAATMGAAAGGSDGCRVLLIDRAAKMGGAVSAVMHRSMCGLYSRTPENPIDTLNGFGQREVIARMIRQAPRQIRLREFGRACVLEFPTNVWQQVLAEICDRPNIDRLLATGVTAVRRSGSRITAIQIAHPHPFWITVGVVIDCTGGGNLLAMAGDDVVQPPDPNAAPMLAGFAVRLAGLRGNLELLRLQIPYALASAVEQGILPNSARFTVFYPGPGDDEGVCKLAVDPDASAMQSAQLLADQVIAHLFRAIPELAAARIVEMSSGAIARDGNRLRGRAVVTEQDVLEARRHGENSVHAWWPIEWWDPQHGPTYTYPQPGEHYDIPHDALRSAAIENLLAAGTCISATGRAAASTRASGICLATGDAAGRIAASMLNS